MPNIIKVTRPRPRPFSEILHPILWEGEKKLCTKFEVCSFAGFGDIGKGMRKNLGSPDPGHASFQEYYVSSGKGQGDAVY